MLTINKTLSTSDLLKTNSLTRQQIFERLDLIKSLLEKKEVEFTKEEENKLEKLIERSNYLYEDSTGKKREQEDESNELQSLIREIEIITKQVSEKYLTNEALAEIAKNTKKEFIEQKEIDLKIREPRTAIRSTSSAEEIKRVVYENTIVIKKDQNNFTLQYPKAKRSNRDSRESIQDNSTDFLFSIKFHDNKAEFIFEKIFKESSPDKMNPQDHLFPEEIQITMLKKLIDSNPEVQEKIRDARKINCIQSTIINQETLLRMSKYLELRSENPNDLDSKKYLSSSPNQSNTQNFMNQLQHVFGIEILNSTPPKVICGAKTASSLKQTFLTR